MNLHPWNLTIEAAIQLQKELQRQLILEDDFKKLEIIAGADLAFTQDQQQAIAGVVVYTYPDLVEIERTYALHPVEFPYVPGLLTFREGPALMKAFQQLKSQPDLILFDGQGIAHPRRMGIASHMGLILEKPTIGVAKSKLWGTYQEPGSHRGDHSPLEAGGQVIGSVLRTRDKVKPLFISPGHRVSLETAVKIVLQCHEGKRLPKPTRQADLYVAKLKRTL